MSLYRSKKKKTYKNSSAILNVLKDKIKNTDILEEILETINYYISENGRIWLDPKNFILHGKVGEDDYFELIFLDNKIKMTINKKYFNSSLEILFSGKDIIVNREKISMIRLYETDQICSVCQKKEQSVYENDILNFQYTYESSTPTLLNRNDNNVRRTIEYIEGTHALKKVIKISDDGNGYGNSCNFLESNDFPETHFDSSVEQERVIMYGYNNISEEEFYKFITKKDEKIKKLNK